jgi:3-methyladenine DNA glycosylase AlkD
MTVPEIFSKLEALGDVKVRAQNTKRGAHENQFGVKLGDIRKVAASIGINNELAKALWETGNIDARFVAALIVDPKTLSVDELNHMVKSERFTWIADWLSSYVIKEHPHKEELRLRWMQSTDPMEARAGWSLTAGRVTRQPEGIDIPALLDRIESEMPAAHPETQWTMNTTLAQIGINHPQYRSRALEIGERLRIYRDYPVSKGCTSPFAPIWINEMVKRQR